MLARMSDDLTYEPVSVPTEPAPLTPVRTPLLRHPLVTGLLGLVVGAGLVGGAWAATSAPAKTESFTMTGELDLVGGHSPVPPENTDCAGAGGYDDIAEGAAVTVYDAGGKVVAQGALGVGRYADPVAFTGACVFSFTAPGVPKGTKFYQVEITHRGKLTASIAEAQSGAFTATLGG